jgi:osmoprotectant transport system ATP-binding protein
MIAFEDVSKTFGPTKAVDGLSFTIAAGEFFVLIGPSGCGKSTTLKMINRLEPHTAGRIRFAGEDIARFRAEALRRRIGYAIQSVGLFPHWTVEQNIATVPRLLRWPRARIRDRVAELLHLLRLDEASRRRYPHQLSGGQQQRVGVARALAADPDVLLMDEPFGALDPLTRDALQSEIARVHQATKKTTVFVTHDMQEALRLASRIAIMDRGRIVQIGAPIALLREPADEFVRSFVGGDDRGIKLLSLETAAERVRPGERAPGPPIGADASLARALSLMIENGTDRLPVIDAAGAPLGALFLADFPRT